MPQLMPLYWLLSTFMFVWIVIMLIELYCYKNKEKVECDGMSLEFNQIFYKW